MLLIGEIASGVVIGSSLGYALQRGGFCMNSAFRSIAFEKDHSLVRAWLLVVVINIIGVNLLGELGFLTPLTVPFFWPALLIGGFIFGIGMVIAGGCASGTCYRSGRGMIGSWAALIGFIFSTAAVEGGVLHPLQNLLRRHIVTIDGATVTIFSLLGVSSAVGRWLIIAVLIVPTVWWLAQAPADTFVLGWGWRRSGVVIGALALLTWIVSALFQRNFGLSFTQPLVSLTRWVVAGDTSGLNITSWLVLSVPIGALLAAAVRDEAHLSLPPASVLVRQGTGGLIMGIGAATAGGCNIGHGITGIATLGIGSILAVLSIMLGCWVMTGIVYRQLTR